MQKKLIILTIIASMASAIAFAQANVTIYGIVDAGYANSSGDRPHVANRNNGNYNFSGVGSGLLAGSRIGFKGEEVIGNGLKAVFTLEYGINVDENGGIGNVSTGLNTRQAFVGLSSAQWGTVTLGRQYAPGFDATGRNDALIASTPSGLNQLNTATTSTMMGLYARINNSISYRSPNWSGFTVSGIYGFGNEADSRGAAAGGDSASHNRLAGLGLNYTSGPLNLDFVYQSHMQVSDLTLKNVNKNAGLAGSLLPDVADIAPLDGVGGYGEGKDINEWFIGGSYDFKVVKVMATYQDMHDKNDFSFGRNKSGLSNDIWTLGAIIPVFGNGKVHVSYANLDWQGKDLGSSDVWTLAYTHSLSKRTTLYTGYTYADNDRDVIRAAGALAATAAHGENNSTFVAGINHSF